MSALPHTEPSLVNVGAESQKATIVDTADVLILISISFTCLRLHGVLRRQRSWNLGDGLLILATLVALAQTICINLAADHGLGTHIDRLSSHNLDRYYKTSYAAQLLAIVAQACAKFSVISFFRAINPHQGKLSRCAITAATALWLLFAFFSSAFQCDLPSPWIYISQACHRGSLMYATTAFNVSTDLYLALFSLPTIWSLNMKLSERIAACGLFASRLLVCGAGIAQLTQFPNVLTFGDQTWSQTNAVIPNQIMMCLSITTANLLSVGKFLYQLQTGQSGTRLADPQVQLEHLPSSKSWSRSHGASSGDTRMPDLAAKSTRARDPEIQSEGGSETGILRVVQIDVDYEDGKDM